MERVYNHADTRRIALILNQVVSQFENTGEITLATSGTTTTVLNPKVTGQSVIVLQPRNASATTANAYISTIANGQFVVNHSADAAERKFDYVVYRV